MGTRPYIWVNEWFVTMMTCPHVASNTRRYEVNWVVIRFTIIHMMYWDCVHARIGWTETIY